MTRREEVVGSMTTIPERVLCRNLFDIVCNVRLEWLHAPGMRVLEIVHHLSDAVRHEEHVGLGGIGDSEAVVGNLHALEEKTFGCVDAAPFRPVH